MNVKPLLCIESVAMCACAIISIRKKNERECERFELLESSLDLLNDYYNNTICRRYIESHLNPDEFDLAKEEYNKIYYDYTSGLNGNITVDNIRCLNKRINQYIDTWK